MILYRELIARALRLAWQHKFLWGLAFFAALGGNGGEYELLFSGSDSISGQSYILGLLRAFYIDGTVAQVWENLQTFFGAYPLPSIFLALLLLLIAMLVIWLIMVAQAGLIWAIFRLPGKSSVTFQQAFSQGMKFFSPVFVINVIAKIVILGVIILVAVPFGIAYIRSGFALYNSIYILAVFFALIPLTIIASFIVKYATAYIIMRDQPWREALRNGWRLFTKNWLVSLEIAFLLFAINLVSSLLLGFTLLLLGLTSNPAGTILFFVILTLFGIFIATFQYATWVNLFLELENGRARSKIQRWSDAWGGKPQKQNAKA